MNENRSSCFDWPLEPVFTDKYASSDKIQAQPDMGMCSHHHTNSRNLVCKGSLNRSNTTSQMGSPGFSHCGGKVAVGVNNPGAAFFRWPSMSDLKTHYFKKLSFLASLAQLYGTTVLWVCTFLMILSIGHF